MRRAAGAAPHRLFLPWVMVATVCLLWMWVGPGAEVVPFHLLWICFALAYGFEAWALGPTFVVQVVVTVTAAAIMVHRAATGVIAWEEVSEVPLMLVLAVLGFVVVAST